MRITLKKFRNEHVVISIQAMIVGMLAGLGAVSVRALIKFFQYISYGDGTHLIEPIQHIALWQRLTVPALGGLITGLLVHFFAKEAKGHGVPEVMTSCLLEEGKIRKTVAAIKALASSVCIGTGGSVGREGPLVQIGSSIGSTIGQFFNQDAKSLRTLVACGAAGGIAAAFNAPFSGCLFAVEIILGDFGVAAFSPIVISSVTATIVSHHFEGDFPTFMIPVPAQFALKSPVELIPYTFLGVLAGVVAMTFTKILYRCEDVFDNWDFPEYLKPMLGGFLIGVIGLFLPSLLGVGYETMEMTLTDQLTTSAGLIILLIIGKIVATSLTLGSGGSGGVFAPSLFIGSLTGSLTGHLFGKFFPTHLIAHPGAYSLVGMGAVVAGATHAPITAIIIIFELTKNYNIILPLMFTCIISSLFTTSLKRESIYTERLVRRGIVFAEGVEETLLKSIPLRPHIKRDFYTFKESEKINDILNTAISFAQHTFPVVDDEKRLLGIVTLEDMKKYFFDRDDLQFIVIAKDLMLHPEYLTADMSLQDAIEYFNRVRIDELPVCDAGRVIGIINEQTIIEIYNNEMKKRHIARSIISRKKYSTSMSAGLELGDGLWMKEIDVPGEFSGKRLKEVPLRHEYNLEVIMVRKKPSNKTIMPRGDYTLEQSDKMIVVGRREDITRLAILA